MAGATQTLSFPRKRESRHGAKAGIQPAVNMKFALDSRFRRDDRQKAGCQPLAAYQTLYFAITAGSGSRPNPGPVGTWM